MVIAENTFKQYSKLLFSSLNLERKGVDRLVSKDGARRNGDTSGEPRGRDFRNILVGYRSNNKTKDAVEFKIQKGSRNLEQDNSVISHYKAGPPLGIHFRTPPRKLPDRVSAPSGS